MQVLILVVTCWIYFIDYANAGSWLLVFSRDNGLIATVGGIAIIGIGFGLLAAFLLRNSKNGKN